MQGDLVQEGGTFSIGASTITIQQNWTKAPGAIFDAGTSTISFIGNTSQPIPSATFNHLIINKGASSPIAPAGNVTVNADLDIRSGILNLGNYTINRSAAGGRFMMGSAATLSLEGSNFPTSYNNYMLDKASTVIYQGSTAQGINGVTYGNLKISNGGTNAKQLLAATMVGGNLTIDNGASLNGNGQTLTLQGDFNQNGTFSAGTAYSEGTLVLATNGGTQKSLLGNITLNNWLLEEGASYKIVDGDITIKGDFTNQGSVDALNRSIFFEGDFLNTGILKSSGNTVFAGTRLQNIQLQAPLQGSLPHPSIPNLAVPPTVEFAGNVAPLFNSTMVPTFGKLTISNTDIAGIRASVGWTVNLDFNVSAGAKFIGGPYTHNFYTSINNNGTILSTGTLIFSPIALAGLQAYPLNFGASSTSFRSTGTLQIGGAQKVALIGTLPTSFTRLVLENTHEDGVSMAALIGSEVRVTDDLIIAANATLHAATKKYVLDGNLVNNGVLNALGADITFTSKKAELGQTTEPAIFSGSGTSTVNNLTVATGAHLSITHDIVTIFGDFTHNGTSFDGSTAEFKFKGTGASSIIAANNEPVSIQHLHVAKTGAGTLTLETPLNAVTSLMIESGTLDAKSQPITTISDTEFPTSPLFSINDGGTFRIASAAMPVFASHLFAANSTVVYEGINQTIKGVQYGNLELLKAGTKTFDGESAQIAGTFTIDPAAVLILPTVMEYNGAVSQGIAALNYKTLVISNTGAKTLQAGTTGIAGAFIRENSTSIDASAVNVTVEYNGANTQEVLPINYYNLKLSNGSLKTFSGTTGIAADFTMTDGASADLLTQENTIDFNGARAQNIPGLAYSNLTSSAEGIKTLQGPITVKKQLLVSKGEIRTGNTKITLGEAEGSIIESETAFVTGTVETSRTLTQSRETFGNLGITITNAATGLTKVSRLTGTAVGVNATSIKRSFIVTPTGVNSGLAAIVEIDYLTHELNGVPEEKLAFYTSSNGIQWLMQPRSKSTFETTENTATLSEVTSLNRFALADLEVPLPVKLISFTGKVQNNGTLLNWKTASEKDNDFFEVERSTDGKNFQMIGKVKGNGTTTVEMGYSFLDAASVNGTVYYRLRQVDFDGKFEHTKIISVKSKAVAIQVEAKVYPNPTTDGVQLQFSGITSGKAVIKMYSAMGTLVSTQQVMIGSDEKIDLSTLAAGTYLLRISGDGFTTMVRVVKH